MAFFPQDRCTVVCNRSQVWFVSSSLTPSYTLLCEFKFDAEVVTVALTGRANGLADVMWAALREPRGDTA
jgi:hypothetical protein